MKLFLNPKQWCVALVAAVAGSGALPQTMNETMPNISPALAHYTKNTIQEGLWERPGLNQRDRSIITLSVLVARNQALELRHQLGLALDHGVTPAEISELITHLAFYAGWGTATMAEAEAQEIFAARKIPATALPPAKPELLPLNKEAEAMRSQMVQQNFGAHFPGVVQYTTDALFLDLWLRPGLAPRDRSLVTVSALIANGQVAQVPYHLNRAMDNGLTRAQVSEMMTQLAFYAGWPNVFSAMPVVKDVLDK